MYNPGRKTKKIKIWASVESFLTASDLSAMTLDKVKEQAFNNDITFDDDILQVDLINLLLAGQESIREIDKLGQQVMKDQFIKSLRAEIINLTGLLLIARPADTVVSKSTQKIVVKYNKHFIFKSKTNWITYKDHRFEIDYTSSPGFGVVDLEIFCQEILNGSGF